VQIETNGEKLLRAAQKKASHPELKRLFSRLAKEEVQHAEWFSNLMPRVQETADTAQLETMGRDLLRDILGEESFSLKELDLSSLGHAQDLLSKMIEFENDTVLFYQMIRSVVADGETLGIIDQIIGQEKHHAQTLLHYLETGSSALPCNPTPKPRGVKNSTITRQKIGNSSKK